ncbi:host specificity factor TipJ family phage tail protein [Aquamicrobium sp. NLF2-7]|uniref:host specificity factor TipJ family phage tail protein n=1 Tax=Aquamicrobium sp. NLF2-7 TaxID=2918753 RepID=UPI001EFBBB45|nr:host specificity factor TipJ family phage tail protein [Aquamicrobium sp. NLF2-7]MCG8272369.1 host specificity factor TipJ family phage tail protein [Aquamicrobium sp. NLF2-7]
MNALVRAPASGEILGPADVITVTAAVHPLKPHAEILILPAGLSLAEIVDEVSRRCHVSRLARGADVSVSGHVIDQVLWPRVRVKSGAHVTVRARAGKAIGGILKSVLMIALSVAASFIVGPAGLGIAAAIGGTAGQVVASLAAGAIMMAGGFALNALFPPTQTRSESNNPSYSISAGRNGASKWGPIPVVLGKVRALPKYAALPYTEFEGDDQYLRLLFVWGYGPINIEDIRIGDTSIAEFEGVEIETFEGYGNDPQQTIYPSEVVQDDLSIDPAYNVPVTRTSAENADEIVLDFVAPAGLCHVSKKGKRQSKVVDFKVEMSPAGANAWVNKGNVQLQGATNDPVRRSFRYVVSKGRYDIRITRLTGDENTTTDFSEVTWTAIKSFRVGDPPISFGKPLAITALRIKASKQLNGVVDTLNALVTSVGKSWNGTSWVEAQETRNPGDLMRLVLQGPANARAVPDSRLDLSGLAAFADHCRAKGYTFDMYRDFTASVRDTLRDIAAAGRGVPTFRDGKWSVTWEDASAPVVQHFTPRNSRDFRWSQTYRTLPQGLRCKFVNAEKDYIEDELLCFADGYNKDNAKLYEQAEFPGVTSGELVYKHGLYRHADAKERPAVYTFSVDFEHLVAQRGDRVAMAYDVVRQGIASGRIQAVAGQQLTLDEPAIMESGKLYGIRIRRRDGTSIVRQVTTNPGTRTVITITGTPPEAGDLYTFGIRDQETGIYRILRIRPGSDLSAEVDLVDDGPNVQTGDSATDIPSGSVTPPAPVSSLTPFGLRAESFVQAGEVGRTYVVRLYWQPVLGPDYTSFEVSGTSDPGIVRKVVAGDQQVAEFDNIQSGLWSFTVRGLMSDGGYTLPSAPLVVPVEVPYDDVGIEPVDLDRLEQDVKGYLDWAGSGIREIERRLEEYDLWMADQDFGNAYDRQKIRQQLTATFDTARAEWTYEVNVLAAADAALSQRIETLKADVGNNSAAITAEAVARAGADAALASDISSLGATVGNNSAAIQSEATARTNADSALAADITTLDAKVFDPDTGLPSVASAVDALSTYAGPDGVLADAITSLSASSVPGDIAKANMRMGVMSGPSGYSRIAFETRYDGTGGYRGAAFGADTPADPGQKTRFWMRADQTVVMDSAGNVSAMFDGGSAYFNNARIRNLTADHIKANSLDAAAVLQDGTLITDLIAIDALSDQTTAGPYTGQIPSTEATILTVPVVRTFADKPVHLYLRFIADVNARSVSAPGAGPITPFVKVSRNDGKIVYYEELIASKVQGESGSVYTDAKFRDYGTCIADVDAPLGALTYRISVGGGITTGAWYNQISEASITAQAWKR